MMIASDVRTDTQNLIGKAHIVDSSVVFAENGSRIIQRGEIEIAVGINVYNIIRGSSDLKAETFVGRSRTCYRCYII